MKLSELVAYLDQHLRIHEIADDPHAVNGLQLEASREIERIALAVDASEETIDRACALRADLLLVHHGLYWSGLKPVVGPLARKLGRAFAAGLSVYSAHLPLDLHPQWGNNVGLARALELNIEGPFGNYHGVDIGIAARARPALTLPELTRRIASAVGPCRTFGRGPERIERIALVSGGGASLLGQSARAGFDLLVSGEGAHYTAIEAQELGIHLVLAGHYRTEVFGVKALGAHLADTFSIAATFIEADTGL